MGKRPKKNKTVILDEIDLALIVAILSLLLILTVSSHNTYPSSTSHTIERCDIID